MGWVGGDGWDERGRVGWEGMSGVGGDEWCGRGRVGWDGRG